MGREDNPPIKIDTMNFMRTIIIFISFMLSLLTCTGQTTLFEGKFIFTLHQQTRPYDITISQMKDSLSFDWKIFRNSRWYKGSYRMAEKSLKSAVEQSWLQPVDGKTEVLPVTESFGFISQGALRDLHSKGYFLYNETTYRLQADASSKKGFRNKPTIHVIADVDHTEMWILDELTLPLIICLKNNPLGIDWNVE